MESVTIDEKIPKIRRIKDSNTQGKLDDLGFFRTPNGSFWDPDEEYFNKDGYDIHGGSYSKDIEYVPGPDWLSELGCYPEDKEKYMNMDLNEVYDEEDIHMEDEFKGDFEDDYIDGEENCDFNMTDLNKLSLGDKKMIDDLIAKSGVNLASLGISDSKSKNKKGKKSKSKNKKKKQEDDEGWETVEEDDE